MNDLRFAVRQLLKSPGFSAVTVLTLAVGIGANTAMFSVVHPVLMRPLPFPEPERLFLVAGGPAPGWEQTPLSFADFAEIRSQSRSYEHIGAWTSFTDTRFTLTGGDRPELVQYALISSDFFAALGVSPAIGRSFTAGEDEPGAGRRIVVSHALWERRFAGQTTLNGQTLALDGQVYEIVGVLPRGFRFVSFPKDPDVWLPLGLDPLGGRRFSRGTRYLAAIGRLNPGTSPGEAQSELSAIMARLQQTFPQFYTGRSFVARALPEQVTGHLRQPLLVLLGSVGCLLLIACANVAGMLLVRARARSREIAVRLALGASRQQILRQLLGESFLLSSVGGAAGLAVAAVGVELTAFLVRGTPSPFIPIDFSPGDFTLDGAVLGFTLTLSCLSAFAFGLAPAWQAARGDFGRSLNESVGGLGGSSRSRFRKCVVAVQVAIALTLLIGAGLMFRSLTRLTRVPPGFAAESLVVAELNLGRSKYNDPGRINAFYQELFDRLRSAPGVTAAGATQMLPLSGSDQSTGFFIEGQPLPAPNQTPHTHQRAVSAGYFEAMGVALLQGRSILDQDTANAPRVAVINETMARRFWPGQDPIGNRFALDFETMRYYPDRPPERDLELGWREIIGVVADVRHSGLQKSVEPEAYLPLPQLPARDMSIVIRTEIGHAAAGRTLIAVVRDLDPEQPVSNLREMGDLVKTSIAQPVLQTRLLGALAGVSALLALVGVYGVLAYAVRQRWRELGLRYALGARRADVMTLILRDGMRPVGMGLVLGLLAALGLTRLLGRMLYDISTLDPLTFSVTAIGLAAAGLLACVLAAWRAARMSPIQALRTT